MLTLAIAFLFIAIFTAVFGFIVAGPAGLLAGVVFLALFAWSMMRHRRRSRGERPPSG